ncbi:MAG: hypothetical protein J7501_14175 [Bdellovibrio sp.]|nr:hypothetical protein [Bdellovibrio sp.]
MKHQLMLSSLVILSIAACSEVKKVDEMHDATVRMSETTDTMKTRTGELKDVTDELYDALRQGNALQLRREAYNSVLQAPTLFKKISEATKYFMSFEFQLWNGIGQDGAAEKREILGQQAAQEFFMEIEELATRDNSVNPLAQPDAKDIYSQDNLTASFNAMAVGMDRYNRKQEQNIAAKPDQKMMSMYSMMEEALLAPRDVAQKGYIREILAHEEKAVQLLQARYNMFPLMFIDVVSKIGDKNLVGQAKMLLMGWEFNVDALSATQLEYLQTEVLEKAVSAKELLIKIGKKPELDGKVARLLAKMAVKSENKTAGLVQTKQQDLLKMIQKIQE